MKYIVFIGLGLMGRAVEQGRGDDMITSMLDFFSARINTFTKNTLFYKVGNQRVPSLR